MPVVAQQSGADPAAVVYDAWEAAKARNIDVLLADTAGRLHTQDPLMRQLTKIRSVIARQIEGESAEISLADSASPTGVRDVSDSSALYVLMPMRV